MPKWDIYHVIAKNMGLEVSESIMKEIDDLIEDLPKGFGKQTGLRTHFKDIYNATGKPQGIEYNTGKSGRRNITVFKWKLKSVAEYYGNAWEKCKENNKCMERVKYYLLHNLAGFLFYEVIPEKEPLKGKETFFKRFEKKFINGVWNSIVNDPEFKWIFPLYNEVLEFLFSKIKLKKGAILFCDDDGSNLQSIKAGNVTVKFCPLCGNIYIPIGGEKNE